MKKIVLSLIIFLLPIVSFASTNTYPRTEDDLRINSWITVTEENKDNILNTPSVNEEEKIYDFADLYTDEEEKNLYTAVYDYTQRRNLDLVIVTINDNFESTQEYADDFYDYNNFGFGSERDGLLSISPDCCRSYGTSACFPHNRWRKACPRRPYPCCSP